MWRWRPCGGLYFCGPPTGPYACHMGHNGDGVGARKRRGHLGPSTRVPCVPLGRSNLNQNQITPEGAHEGAQRERNGHQLSTRHHTDQPARSAAPVQKPKSFKSVGSRGSAMDSTLLQPTRKSAGWFSPLPRPLLLRRSAPRRFILRSSRGSAASRSVIRASGLWP